MICLVISMSARDGVGSPEVWLCTRMIADDDSACARLTDGFRVTARIDTKEDQFKQFVVGHSLRPAIAKSVAMPNFIVDVLG